jgi:hypothetical protein
MSDVSSMKKILDSNPLAISKEQYNEVDNKVKSNMSIIDEFFNSGVADKFLNWVVNGGKCPEEYGTSTFKDRIPIITTLSLMINIKRIFSTAEFITKAESSLFNMDEFNSIDDEATRLEYYKIANKSLQDNLESFRKFLVQNKDLFESQTDDDELKALLKQLPQDRKRELINTIKNVMTNTVDVNKE